MRAQGVAATRQLARRQLTWLRSWTWVDVQSPESSGGENYGWRIMEGQSCFNPSACSSQGLTLPVTVYSHVGGDCSVTGGVVFREAAYPGMDGVYFYGDFCSGRIRGLGHNGLFWESTVLSDTALRISSFGEDEGGALYLSDYLNGHLYRITENAVPMPSGKETFTYPPTVLPTGDILPAGARPVGVGSVAAGGATVDLRVVFAAFSGPVDIYGAFVQSGDPATVNVLQPDLTFVQLSVADVDRALATGVKPEGVQPWKSALSGPLDESPLGSLSAAALAAGTYQLYLLATPAGTIERYYVWITSFVIP
jgi:hypothetical protein